MMELYNKTTPKGRKDYKCFLCGEEIPKGEKHVRETGKYEGYFFDRRSHSACNRAVGSFLEAERWQDGFAECEVYEHLREKACYGCEQYDGCELNIPRCPIVIGKLEVS